MTTTPVKLRSLYPSGFTGEFTFLSNFYLSHIVYEDIVFPSVEHAFQAAKTLDLTHRRSIATFSRPAQAKSHGRKIVPLRPDWDRLKVRIMLDLLRAKFSGAELAMRLVATEDVELVEWNNWHDVTWGVCTGTCTHGHQATDGLNLLGHLLTIVRDEILDSPERVDFHDDSTPTPR